MIPLSVESCHLNLFLRCPDNGINSPFQGKDEKNTSVNKKITGVIEINTGEIETNTSVKNEIHRRDRNKHKCERKIHRRDRNKHKCEK
ncbi:MAG: hypothetical protein LBN98_05980 [Prevotellaceae bacterium]|jgi:hypothetical protein|nr:hypothetical protein [Prevotellaceae bacterium]